MSVLFVAFGAITVGIILAGILSNLKDPVDRCGIVMLEKRRFNVCVEVTGHKGQHTCADGKEF